MEINFDENEIRNSENSLLAEKMTLFEILKTLFLNQEYICILLSITFLYYIVAGITYWAPNYLVTQLNVDKNVSAVYYSFTSIVLPIPGAIAGGTVSSYYGGYNSIKT